MAELKYKIESFDFDGPLDLLLTLIQKNKVSIEDIPIALICDQYMAYITEAERLDMDLASEFIVMASELMLIKSKMLLPKAEPEEEDPRAELAEALLKYQQAKAAAALLFCFPGSPMVYYGDEVGMEGFEDPFNRQTYPWGHEDWEILGHYRRLGKLRKDHPALRLGDIHFFQAGDKHLGYTRSYQGKTYKIYANRSGDPWAIPTHRVYFGVNMQVVARDQLIIGPRGFCITEDL